MGFKKRPDFPPMPTQLDTINAPPEIAPASDAIVEEIGKSILRVVDELRKARVSLADVRDKLQHAKRDVRDMYAARQTRFARCACGRMREDGVICPTNQEGGTCKTGE